MTVTDNHCGTAADQIAHGNALQIQYGQDHGQGQQRQNREHAVDQRDAEVLHRDGGQIRNQQRQHQFRRFQFADLPFAHEPQTGHNQKIENDGAD